MHGTHAGFPEERDNGTNILWCICYYGVLEVLLEIFGNIYLIKMKLKSQSTRRRSVDGSAFRRANSDKEKQSIDK